MHRDIGLRIHELFLEPEIVRTASNRSMYIAGSFGIKNTRENFLRRLKKYHPDDEEWAERHVDEKWNNFISETEQYCYGIRLYQPTFREYMMIDKVLRSYDTTYNKKTHVFKRTEE